VVESKLTHQTGTSRLFVSPPLEPGRTFTYTEPVRLVSA